MKKPLNKLKEWKLEEEHQKSFKKLKDKITNQLLLTLSRREGKFRLKIDTLNYAI